MTIIASKEKERKEYFRFSKEKFFKINLKLDASNRTQSKNKYKTLESNLSSYFQFHTDSTNKEQRFNPLLPSFFFFLAKRNDIYIRSQLRLLFRVFWSAVGDNPVTRFPACIETSGRNLIMNASQISRFEVHGESDI